MFVQNNTRVVPLFCVYFLPCILKIDGKNEIGGKKKEKKIIRTAPLLLSAKGLTPPAADKVSL